MSISTPLLTPKFAVNSRIALAERATKIAVDGLDFYYGRTQALENISLNIPEQAVMAFIGPSGCGKTTFLRTLNRMNDVIPGT
ncbi:MAG TPA: ATP-binding cassette domain-containing protein, partial [Pyrinomonadaceae bacterium]|nr:ATP-binding cassette domain-containing protein [Pyrinomonadaceae bacterium]